MKTKINIEIIDDINTISDYTEYLHTTKDGLITMYKNVYEKLMKETQSSLVDYTVAVEIED